MSHKLLINTRVIGVILISLFIIHIHPSFLWSSSTITWDQSLKQMFIGGYVEVLKDEGGQWTIDDVQDDHLSKHFIQSQQDILNFGFTDAAYWIRFQIKNSGPEPLKLLLQIDFPLIDSITLFTPNLKGYDIQKAGMELPFYDRNIKHRTFLFSMNIPNSETSTYYLRVSSQETLQLPLKLWAPNEFSAHNDLSQLGLGIYYGIVAVMAIYNLFLWFTIRESSYFYYVSYITLLGILFIFFPARFGFSVFMA